VYHESIPGYQPGCYTAKLEWAASEDGTAVPITLAYRTDLMKQDGSNKAILHGCVLLCSGTLAVWTTECDLDIEVGVQWV
jgi:hypothetical protein